MYILVSHLEKEFGVHYAIGGVAAIARAMARVIEDQGGRIILGAEADEILVRNGRAQGVKLTDGRVLTAPLIVSNAEKHKRNPEFVDDAIATIANSTGRMQRLIEQLQRREVQTLKRRVSLAEIAGPPGPLSKKQTRPGGPQASTRRAASFRCSWFTSGRFSSQDPLAITIT